jgi:hypothetical protein
MARTNSMPGIAAITAVGVTPYSVLGAGWASMGWFQFMMTVIILNKP